MQNDLLSLKIGSSDWEINYKLTVNELHVRTITEEKKVELLFLAISTHRQ